MELSKTRISKEETWLIAPLPMGSVFLSLRLEETWQNDAKTNERNNGKEMAFFYLYFRGEMVDARGGGRCVSNRRRNS